MPHWHVEVLPDRVYLHHMQEDGDGPAWRGEVELISGAPSLDFHPELTSGFLSISQPVLQEGLRLTWSYSIPDEIGGVRQIGADRRFMLLEAQGAWKLLLRFPSQTPPFVYRAVAQGFTATPLGRQTARRRNTMAFGEPSNSGVGKPASLPKPAVPVGDAVPPAAKDGINSIKAS